MTAKEQQLYVTFVYNKRSQLEEDVHILQNNIRWRRVDEVDCLEFIIAQTRLNTFNEIIDILDVILKMCPANQLKKRVKHNVKRN